MIEVECGQGSAAGKVKVLVQGFFLRYEAQEFFLVRIQDFLPHRISLRNFRLWGSRRRRRQYFFTRAGFSFSLFKPKLISCSSRQIVKAVLLALSFFRSMLQLYIGYLYHRMGEMSRHVFKGQSPSSPEEIAGSSGTVPARR